MKVFITGSTTGLGLLTGEKLLAEGHEVLFHARNQQSKINPHFSYVYGDLQDLNFVKKLASELNERGSFDTVIHNAGIYEASAKDLLTVNVLAPFMLTNLMSKPRRLIFLSSRMHMAGKLIIDQNECSYSDTKLFDLILAKYFSRLWPDVYSNAVDPGWVPTRMGGSSAPDNLELGYKTQAWLATSLEKEALVSGKYFHHQVERRVNPIADSIEAQDRLVQFLTERSHF